MNATSRVAMGLALIAWMVACQASAQESSQGRRVLSLTQENDFWTGTDRHYTHGIKLAYAASDDRMIPWTKVLSEAIPAPGIEVESRAGGFVLGQNIYTPADIRTAAVIHTDRPFAGWLYCGLALQRQGVTGHGRMVWESWGVDLGVIGPAALGEAVQDFIHELAGSNKPLGWHHQLRNEPGVALKYQRTYRYALATDSGWGLDCLPHGGASLGNVSTDARLGATLRLGYHLPGDYGPQNIDSLALDAATGQSRPSFTCYLFGGVEGRAVAYSALFNGNLYKGSHQISKEPVVADFKSGLVVGHKGVELAFTLIMRTREFVGQMGRDSFGSLAFRASF